MPLYKKHEVKVPAQHEQALKSYAKWKRPALQGRIPFTERGSSEPITVTESALMSSDDWDRWSTGTWELKGPDFLFEEMSMF